MKSVRAYILTILFIISAVPACAIADTAPTPDLPPPPTPPADTTAPVITVPDTQYFATTTFPASWPALAMATATDNSGATPTISYDPQTFSAGTTTITWTATDPSGNTATATSLVHVSEEASISVRDGSTLIGPVLVELPDTGSADVSLTASAGGASHAVGARSVLALLSSLDAASAAFDITDLQYYDSFGAFYLNCLSVPAASASPQCGSWQYVLNGADPGVGADKSLLSNGDTAIIYFGSARSVALSSASITLGQSVMATAQTYEPATDTFSPLTGVTIGLTQTNPLDPWTPLEIATSTVDSNGQAVFTPAATGTYAVGIKDDFYYPTVSLTVADATSSSESAPAAGGGGGGLSHNSFNIPLALAFLGGKQNADGSFGNDMLSDWAALAFAAADPGTAKTKLRTYLLGASPSLSSATDYERHAMALMALGIDPYKGAGRDFISPLVAKFDGTQVGDASLVNDDIFALFPLSHAGYDSSDPMIQKIVVFIVSKQHADGSWDGGADVTAAAVQALSPLSSLSGVSDALSKAQAYLHTQQAGNGGFGSSFTTAWAMQAIAALSQTESQWAPAFYYPSDYLAAAQQPDGGVEPSSAAADTRVWATEYAIPGILLKSWHSLLGSFSKPAAANTGSNPAATGGTTATSTATTTPAAATSTIPVATTTQPLATTTLALSIDVPVAGTSSSTPAKKTLIVRADPVDHAAQIETAESTSSPIDAQAQTAAAANASTGIPTWLWLIIAAFILAAFGGVAYAQFASKR